MANSDHGSDQFYDARVIANYILYYHYERSEPITQLRLYKLLYFAHGWHLLERHKPLVWNDFEAWKNGPVVKVVRDNFSAFKDDPIEGYAKAFDLLRGETVQLAHRLDVGVESFIAGVIEAYRSYTAGELSELTHLRGSAWDSVWKSKEPLGRFGLRLKNDEILRDFQDVVDKGEGALPYSHRLS
jgi:uncharacterized phage-associated protein